MKNSNSISNALKRDISETTPQEWWLRVIMVGPRSLSVCVWFGNKRERTELMVVVEQVLERNVLHP
jgi:hypothetical protein